ncbi:MAG: Na/Pi symporter, partial [Gammaproteobacteria bacterium]|nr:Na/Pi symporter [Gammaproteobacteria bacterium]
VLPLILIGALMRLFATGKLQHLGLALAGFGLIFVGIDMLQSGMHALQDWFSFERFPADTILGRLQLVAFGLLFTIITQSSSAGVAATLTALFAGMINFQQAAALVIGMDIGTTVTAFIATIGGGYNARRTGYSHVIYNLMTGTMALLIITPYMLTLESISPGFTSTNAEISLVAFHTFFNTLGVLIILPFTRHFVKLIEYLVPEKKPVYTRQLDLKILNEPEAALIVVKQSIQTEIKDLLLYTISLLRPGAVKTVFDKFELRNSLKETQFYIDQIELAETKKEWQSLINLIHVTDHMARLFERCDEEHERANAASQSKRLKPHLDIMIANYLQILNFIENNQWQNAADISEQTKEEIQTFVQPYRQSIVTDIGANKLNIPEGTRQLEAIRWLSRVNNHVNKIIHHFAQTS